MAIEAKEGLRAAGELVARHGGDGCREQLLPVGRLDTLLGRAAGRRPRPG